MMVFRAAVDAIAGALVPVTEGVRVWLIQKLLTRDEHEALGTAAAMMAASYPGALFTSHPFRVEATREGVRYDVGKARFLDSFDMVVYVAGEDTPAFREALEAAKANVRFTVDPRLPSRAAHQ